MALEAIPSAIFLASAVPGLGDPSGGKPSPTIDRVIEFRKNPNVATI